MDSRLPNLIQAENETISRIAEHLFAGFDSYEPCESVKFSNNIRKEFKILLSIINRKNEILKNLSYNKNIGIESQDLYMENICKYFTIEYLLKLKNQIDIELKYRGEK